MPQTCVRSPRQRIHRAGRNGVELAAMVDTLKEGSLVFLNETFQNTAYAEGAEGLYNLLKHFSRLISAGYWFHTCVSLKKCLAKTKQPSCIQQRGIRYVNKTTAVSSRLDTLGGVLLASI